jgi:hypothetical protein
VVGGELENHAADPLLIAEAQQGGGDTRQKILVHPGEHEAELGRRAQGRVGALGILQRPTHELGDEVASEAGEGSALGASQQDDDRFAMLQAEVEQLASQHVVRRFTRQCAHVASGTERADACARSVTELARQRGGHDGVEQLVLVAEVFVQIADRRFGALSHRRHGRRGEAELGKGLRGSPHKTLPDVGFRDLRHLKENYAFSFQNSQLPEGRSGVRDRGSVGAGIRERRRDQGATDPPSRRPSFAPIPGFPDP